MLATVHMQIPQDLALQLDSLAEHTGMAKNRIFIQALQDYLERESWQLAELQKAIQEADANDFASPETLAKLDAKWGYSAS